MEIDIKAMIAQAKAFQHQQPFGVSFDELPENYPADVPKENRKTSIAFLLAWAVKNNCIIDEKNISPKIQFFDIQNLDNPSPIELLERLDDKFLPSYLAEREREFLLAYYWPGWKYNYGVDFDKIFVGEYSDPLLVKPGFSSTWHVPGTWTEFEKIQSLISKRFTDWKSESI